VCRNSCPPPPGTGNMLCMLFSSTQAIRRDSLSSGLVYGHSVTEKGAAITNELSGLVQ